MNGTSYVYALTEPDTGCIRYVGATRTTVAGRVGRHIYDAKHARSKSLVLRWICELLEQEMRPSHRTLAVVSTEDEEYFEVRAVAKYRELLGDALLNATVDGRTTKGSSFYNDPEFRRKIATALTGRKQTAETVEKRVSQIRGRKNPKISASLIGNQFGKGNKGKKYASRKPSL